MTYHLGYHLRTAPVGYTIDYYLWVLWNLPRCISVCSCHWEFLGTAPPGILLRPGVEDSCLWVDASTWVYLFSGYRFPTTWRNYHSVLDLYRLYLPFWAVH